jgi:hypothetical protein
MTAFLYQRSSIDMRRSLATRNARDVPAICRAGVRNSDCTLDFAMSDKATSYDRIPAALVGLLAVFLAAGMVASWLSPVAAEDAPSLPDLSGAQLVEVRNASGRTILSGEFRERTDALGNIEKDAALVDRRGRRVIGEIEIEIPGPGAMSPAQELEIDVMEIEPNGKHSLFIDDREVATFTTDDRGSIDMRVHAVPAAVPSR